MEIYMDSKGKGKNIIILDKKESQTLMEAFDIATKANKRKIKIKKMHKEFENELACW